MLSHQRGSLQTRQRQHRRQLSTPTTLEAGKVPALPAPALQRFQAHRRGQSLDQRPLHARRPQPGPHGPDMAVPHGTNGAVFQQPQRLMVHGTQCQQPIHDGHLSVPPHPTPISEPQAFTQDDMHAITHQNNVGNDSSINPIGGVGNASEVQPLRLALSRVQQQQLMESTTTSPYDNDTDSRHFNSESWGSFQQGFPIAIQQQADDFPTKSRRFSAQSDVRPQIHQPCTPIIQTNDSYHPITPATTPFRLSVDLSQVGEDMQNPPTKSQYLTVPSSSQHLHMQPAKPFEDVPGPVFTESGIEMPSPPATAPLELNDFDVFDYQQASGVGSFPSLHGQNNTSSSSVASSFYAPSEQSDVRSFEEPNQKAQKVAIQPITPRRESPKKTPTITPNLSPSKPKLSPRVASINHLNLDSRVHASINKTGISIDEIASFIHGPDPEDGKWVCLHTGCGRRFGRKENIKSHVQTHLGDRQYKCDHCNKCFVRGHDLKRHAKIHTGDKPYECLCGNVFARHDALTRHKQRGMCIGAYKGIVRKVTKRGRPRKQRPETGKEREKAAKSRQRTAGKSFSSSTSGSDASEDSPPTEVFRNMHIRNSSSASNEAPVFHTPDYSLPQPVFNVTPPTSPSYNTGSDRSVDECYRSVTPRSEYDMAPQCQSTNMAVDENRLSVIDNRAFPNPGVTNSDPLLSPHHAPTLTDSSTLPDLDVFINPGPTTFSKDGLQFINDPDMVELPNYYATSMFGEDMDLFPGKGFPATTTDDDFFSFQFHPDEQTADVLTKDLLVE